MRAIRWSVVWLSCLTLLIAVSALAGAEAVDVDVPGTNMVWMRIRVALPGLTAYEYRDLIHERIADALAPGFAAGEPLTGAAVRVAASEGGAAPAVYIGDVMIVEVDAAHARIHGSTQEGLARRWAAQLAEALDVWAEINRRLR